MSYLFYLIAIPWWFGIFVKNNWLTVSVSLWLFNLCDFHLNIFFNCVFPFSSFIKRKTSSFALQSGLNEFANI